MAVRPFAVRRAEHFVIVLFQFEDLAKGSWALYHSDSVLSEAQQAELEHCYYAHDDP